MRIPPLLDYSETAATFKWDMPASGLLVTSTTAAPTVTFSTSVAMTTSSSPPATASGRWKWRMP